MSRVLLDEHDPTIRTLIDSDDDGNLVLRHEQNVTALLDHNQRIKSVIGNGITRDHDAPRYIAKLSGLVLADALHKGLISIDPGGDMAHVVDQKKFRKWLNDRDNRKFRTSEGRV